MKNKLDFADLLALVGIVVLSAGLWQIYHPLAFIGAGAYLFLCSIAAGRPSK